MPDSPSLPRLMLIADGFCDPETGDRVLQVISSGLIPWVQLRDHGVRYDVFGEEAERMVGAIRHAQPHTRISLNGHVKLAEELGVDVHVGFRGPHPSEVRSVLGQTVLVGFSAHAATDLSPAMINTVDYFTVSPVSVPISKPHIRAAEPGLLASCADLSSKPVFALGGVTPDRVRSCLSTGAYGVAVVGGILRATDPILAASRYVNALSGDQ